MPIWFIALVALQLAILASAQDSSNEWVYPPPAGPNAAEFDQDKVMSLGSIVTLQWKTTSSSFSIQMWQQIPVDKQTPELDPTDVGAKVINDSVFVQSCDGEFCQTVPTTSLQWTVQPYAADLSFSPIFYLYLDSNDSAPGFGSHYFNITDKKQTTSSSSSSSTTTSHSSTSSSGSSQSSTSSTSSSTTSAATNSPQNGGNSSSDSTALKVGLGVGLGLGIPLVLILGVWVGLKAARGHRSAGPGPGLNYNLPMYEQKRVPQETVMPVGYSHVPQELPADRDRLELAG
ncbi:hypothetical protein NA57DRAFT_53162 [Rhizodiscina lignyota]|uniref:Mid2 domain-containing protein n=1 Tax=Rhizodiscina lignyota TaxID=1504668 RepID=A0A9P4M8M1_9PEZI|nr:hypothetical protein NA57DRAFT_53162 [Rhizodiscina lignyota]